uniref:Uncharacterized protein n=1 Tax=Ananas comosus var. bracteatus TaxID=296719 RepID=A0A6V7NK00_ANACO|nr:unnamed protein product [Ananas comosus var. bracteatus]
MIREALRRHNEVEQEEDDEARAPPEERHLPCDDDDDDGGDGRGTPLRVRDYLTLLPRRRRPRAELCCGARRRWCCTRAWGWGTSRPWWSSRSSSSAAASPPWPWSRWSPLPRGPILGARDLAPLLLPPGLLDLLPPPPRVPPPRAATPSPRGSTCSASTTPRSSPSSAPSPLRPAPSSSTSSASTPSTSPPSSPSPPTSSSPPAPPSSPCSSTSPRPRRRRQLQGPRPSPVHFPGVRPIPARDMHPALSDRDTDAYRALVRNFGRLPDSRGILVNTFEALEPGPARALRDGLPLPGAPCPPHLLRRPPRHRRRRRGTAGGGAARVPRVARRPAGAERGVPLLREHGRVLGGPAAGDGAGAGAERPRLPVGGAEPPGPVQGVRAAARAGPGRAAPGGVPGPDRGARARGPVVGAAGGGAAPRRGGRVREPLRVELVARGHHRGGALVCWPLYAEQRMNKVFLVDEIRVGVAVDGYDQVLVAADEVERKVRLVMETEDGERLRARAAELKDKAAAALDEGARRTPRFKSSSRIWRNKKGMELPTVPRANDKKLGGWYSRLKFESQLIYISS